VRGVLRAEDVGEVVPRGLSVGVERHVAGFAGPALNRTGPVAPM
jgi:hypothetical protein